MTAEPALGVTASFTGRRWLWRGGEDRVGLGIAERLGLPEIVGRLLAARGVGVEAAADFLLPTLRALLPNPSVLLDMDAAAERLARAVRAGECVAVFGDYDVDGACSAAILTAVLRELGCRVLTHVPDRIREGYGPNAPALLGLAEAGATVVCCVDCGTAAAAILAVLDGRADVVVLDHHKSDGVPAVLATVNPSRLDDRSGLRGLCAAAVTFLAAVATVRVLRREGHFRGRPEPDLLGLLDLVALATVCDVMPLTGLNRALVAQGLKVMGRRTRPGLNALLEVAMARDHPTAFTCGFALGPRINAAGRIGESDLGLRLLLSRDAVEARELAGRLDETNRQRQQVEAGVLDAATAQATAQVEAGHPVLLVSAADWHPGIVGIVAGRLRERFNRPALVAGQREGTLRGSGRSVPGIDIGAAVIAALQGGLLLQGGGHLMAAGFTLEAHRLAEFHAFLDERMAAAAHLPPAADLPVEGAITVAGATAELAEQVGRLAPFGPGNEEPVLVVPRARVVRADRIGREGATLRLLLEGEGGGRRLKALLFRADKGPGDGALGRALSARGGAPVHLAGHLRAESWQGTVSAGLFVTDAAPA